MQTLAEYPEYELVRCLRRTDTKELLLFRHRELNRCIVQRILYRADAGVYQKLSCVLHPNLLEIYEAVQDLSLIHIYIGDAASFGRGGTGQG